MKGRGLVITTLLVLQTGQRKRHSPPPSSRGPKPRLARLLAHVQVGIALNEHTDASGELVFRQASVTGLEGIVSKRLSAPYRSVPGLDQGQEPRQSG
jgi:hypothetical protein